MHSIVQKVEQYAISRFMVINLDLTSTKFARDSKSILAEAGSNSVQAGGANDKRMITATFAITLSWRIPSNSADLWG